MDGTQMMVITGDGELAWTMTCRFLLVTGTGCAAPAGLRPAAALRLCTVQLPVSARGGIMVAPGQVGLIHAGKIVTVSAGDHSSG